jgi:hypothetical protein
MVFSEDIVINHDSHKLTITPHTINDNVVLSEKKVQPAITDTVVYIQSV